MDSAQRLEYRIQLGVTHRPTVREPPSGECVPYRRCLLLWLRARLLRARRRGLLGGLRLSCPWVDLLGSLGGPSGDLYVQIHIKDHQIFQREGNDLYCEVPIDFATATLGGSIEVPTLNGKLKINIPSGTQTSKLFRLRGKGMPAMRYKGSGDLLCQVKLETPVNLNSKQKQLLKDFSSSCNAKQHPESNSFFGKMKSFFE